MRWRLHWIAGLWPLPVTTTPSEYGRSLTSVVNRRERGRGGGQGGEDEEEDGEEYGEDEEEGLSEDEDVDWAPDGEGELKKVSQR